jgi:hypothetical protein
MALRKLFSKCGCSPKTFLNVKSFLGSKYRIFKIFICKSIKNYCINKENKSAMQKLNLINQNKQKKRLKI